MSNNDVPDVVDEQYPHYKKPLNVVILYPDDMRHDSLSCAGTQLVQTPFLDSLAKKGIRFTHNCVTTSICWISRATLFTGQYLARHKSGKLRQTTFYEHWNTTWPYLLQKERGYYVGHVGKWQFRDIRYTDTVFNWTRMFEQSHWNKWKGKKVHTTDHTERSVIDFLRERPQDRPFAVTAAFYPPKGVSGERFFNPKPKSEHLYTNVTVPEAFDWNASWHRLPRDVFSDVNLGRDTWNHSFGTPEKYQKNIKDMYRMITEVDAACGNIVNELEKQGILNETMVIFSSDNGFLHGEHGLSGKWFPFQESIRVPLIVWDPRMPESQRGKPNSEFTLNIDLAPTILGAAGQIPVPPGMQGRDLSDLYLHKKNVKDWRTDFYYEHPTHGGSERVIPKSSALVRKDLKYMRFDNYNVEMLFHLETDPLEHNDVLNNPVYAKRLEELKARYQELKNEVEKPPPYTGITV